MRAFETNKQSFDAYCSYLKSDLLHYIGGYVIENGSIAHNKVYPRVPITLNTLENGTECSLECTGECDFELPNGSIIDIKCYKNVDKDTLRQFFYQTLIYSKLAENVETDLMIVELNHNIIYTFKDIRQLESVKILDEIKALWDCGSDDGK